MKLTKGFDDMTTSLNFIQTFMKNQPLEELQAETQNEEYEGYTFNVGETTYRSRLAKLTPKKKGYFVAFWEKDETNTNQAYLFSESPDYTIVAISDEEKQGLFLFPKTVLLKQKILKTDTQKGKMAIRVYPTWETDLNPTATKTQNWQKEFFFDLS